MNTVTCGSWRAMPLAAGRYEITCSALPEFREVVSCTQDEAGALVVRLQSTYRADLLRLAS